MGWKCRVLRTWKLRNDENLLPACFQDDFKNYSPRLLPDFKNVKGLARLGGFNTFFVGSRLLREMIQKSGGDFSKNHELPPFKQVFNCFFFQFFWNRDPDN